MPSQPSEILVPTVALVALLAGAAGACRQRAASQRPRNEPVSPSPPAALRLEIVVPPEVGSGERVPIVLRARNTGEVPLELYLRGRTIAFDIVVARDDGAVVWQRLRSQTIPAILRVETLAPGQSLELSADWDQRTNDGKAAPSGRYAVQGILPTDAPEPLKTAPAALRITPR